MELLVILALPCIAYLFAQWSNPYTKVKLMRGLLKFMAKGKNFIVVCAMFNGGRSFKSFAVNTNSQSVRVGKYTWIFDDNWLRRNEIIPTKDGIKIKDQPEKGSKIKEDDMKYDEGIPVLFVDYETFVPRPQFMNIVKPVEGGVTPFALDAFMVSLIDSELAKATSKFVEDLKKMEKNVGYLLIICILVGAAVGYNIYNSMQVAAKDQASMSNIIDSCNIKTYPADQLAIMNAALEQYKANQTATSDKKS